MKTKRGVFTLLLVSVMMVSLFAGCIADSSQAQGESGEAMNFTWWTLDAQLDPAGVAQIVASFQTRYPNFNLEVFGHTNESLHQNLQISAVNNTLPSMWFQWGGALGGRYVEYGVTKDLGPFAAANNWDEKFTAASLELLTLHDQLTFYPRVVNFLTVYYRKDIFENLGLSVPTTMDEFHAVVEAIHAAGIIPINTCSVPGWHIMRLWEQFLEHYAGAEMHNQLQVFEVPWEGNEAVIKSFSTLQEYAQKGYFPDGFISMEAGELPLLLYPGLAAMQIEGQWMDGALINDGQDLANYGFFALPNGGTNRVSGFGEGFQFNRNLTDEELRIAVEFLDYFFEPHNMAAFPSMYPSVLPMIGRESDVPPAHINVPHIIETASANGVFTINDQALPPIVCDTLFNVMDYVCLGTMTPEEAAAEMQRAVERHFAAAE